MFKLMPLFTFITFIILVLQMKSYMDKNNLEFKEKSSSLDKLITFLKLFIICLVPILNVMGFVAFVYCIYTFDDLVAFNKDEFIERK